MKQPDIYNLPLAVSELFYSIQGEGTRAGLPCVFVRLQGCNLRCEWCDTEYAQQIGGGHRMEFREVKEYIEDKKCSFVEFTGGEPLLHPELIPTVRHLCDKGLTVAIETNGSLDISVLDTRAVRIMDVKCPGSGMEKFNLWENMEYLQTHDEVKFVLRSEDDYLYSKKIIEKYDLIRRTASVLISAVHGSISPESIAGWMLRDRLEARLQLQLHKIIYDPSRRGV
ncbi:MAG: radical SAM protein [Candidatus Kapaibacterium sp.]